MQYYNPKRQVKVSISESLTRFLFSSSVSILLILITSVGKAQVPTEVPIYGKFTVNPGLYSIKNSSSAQKGTSNTFGSLLSFSNVMYRDNRFSEVYTDIPSAWLAAFIEKGSLKASPSVYNITLKGIDETALSSDIKNEDYKLAFFKGGLLGLSQTFDIYNDFMLGYHAGWDGMSAGFIDKNRELLSRTLDLNYLSLGPVIAYQNNDFRIEAKYLFLRSKKIENSSNEMKLSADYFFMNKEETLGLATGLYINRVKMNISNDRKVGMFSIGFRISFIYPSIWSLA